jgi:hypothetical protein
MAKYSCTLTEDQIRGLYKAVSGKIIADKNNGIKHDIEDYMKKLYDMLKNAPNGSEATAMDYIQHIPRMLLAAKGTMSEDLSDYLSESGVDLNRIDKLRVQFKDIENVKSFLNTTVNNPLLETAKEVVSAALPAAVIDGAQYTQIEDKDKQQKEKANQEKPFDALPETALAQVNQEAQDYDGIEYTQNIPDPDPKIKTYFSVVRLINKFINKNNKSNANDLGIYLRAVRENAVPVEDLYIRHQKYLSSTTGNKTPEDKQKDRETGDTMLLVYTDKEGNFLHFDSEGNITTKEAGGTIAYSSIRRVYKNSNGTRSVAKVQSVEDLAKKPGAASKEELQEGRNTEMDILEKLRDHVKNNPEDRIIFSVTAGKNGYVKEDFSVRNRISDIELENGFSPFYAAKNSGMLQEGGVYFMVPDYEMPVLIKRPKFSEVTNFSEAIASVLFGDMKAQDKIDLLSQFVNVKKTELYEKDGEVYVKFENSQEVIDTSDAANRDLFIQNLNKETVNINKNLLGKSFNMPTLNTDGSVKVDSKLYNNFLSDNFYTNLQKNTEGKIVNLNAYNVLQITPESTNKLFPAPTQSSTSVSTDTKADIERRRQEELKKNVQDLKDKRNSLRREDGVVPKENMVEWQQLGKDVIEAEKKAIRGNNENFISIRTEKDGVLSDEDAINAENEIENIIQKIIKGEITLAQAMNFIQNKYKLLANENLLLLNYINDRTSNAPEIGNNKQSFSAWRKGKYDAELAALESISNFKAEQATPSDNPLDVLREKLKNSGRLKKDSSLSSEATDQQIAAAEEWYKTSPLAQHVPFQVLFNIVNSDASADFTLAGITLYQGSNFSDLYHEGWHVFSQMFLTKEQKQKLYGEARKLKGSFETVDGRTMKFSEAEDIELEEFMAEDFRKYILSGQKSIIDGRPARNSIFKKIFNFLKELFKGQSYTSISADMKAVGTIKNLYDKLYIGDVNEYRPSLNNVQFTLLNKGIQALNTSDDQNNGLTYQDSMTIVQTIDSELAATITELGGSLGSVFTDPSLTESVYSIVRDRIAQLGEKLDPNSSGARIVKFALDNWGSYRDVASGKESTGVLAFHKLRSDYLTFDDKYSEMIPDEKVIFEDKKEGTQTEDNKLEKSEAQLAEEFGSNVFERKGNENSVYTNASNEIVYLIKSLPAMDKNGKPELNSLGSAKLVDFNRTWGIVINAVAGSVNKSDMYDKLEAASKVHPELIALVERLQKPMDKTNIASDAAFIHMWTKFHQDFSVYRIPITEVQVIREVDDKKATGGFEVRFVESDPVRLQVERNFTNSFQSSRPTQFISRTPDGVNKLEVGKVLTAFPRKTLNQGNNSFQFLKAIGFYLTDNASVKAQVLKSAKAISFLYDRLEVMEDEGKVVTNPIFSFNQPYIKNGRQESGESGRVREIMDIEGKYSNNYSNNSITNVQGDQEYDLSLNNSITQLLKELNDLSKDYAGVVDQPHMAHLNVERNPFAKYSILLNSLFDLPVTHKEVNNKNAGRRRKVKEEQNAANTTMNIVNLNGIKSMINDLQAAKEAEGGIKTTSLDINSKFLMDMHSMIESGVMELTRRASKSSAFGLSVSKIFTKFNENDPTAYISTGYFAEANNTKSNNAAVELLKDKIAAEMERIAIVKTGAFDNVPGFKVRGKTFTMFDDILSDDLKEDLIKAADVKNSFDIVNSPEFSQRIFDDVVTYLDALYEENKEVYDEMPFLSQQMLAKINKLAVADKTVANRNSITMAKAEEIAVRSFTVNNLIHNMEVISLIDGDLAMYNHLKEDYNKRNASVTSTGRIFSTDQSDYIIMSGLRRGLTYANKLGVPPEDFNGVINTIIFGDNNVKSKYHDEYLEALTAKFGKEKAEAILTPYEKMNEGDGQGWITFDAYRELAMLEGSWNTATQGVLYEKIIKGEEVGADDLAEFFPPRKYQYAGPLQTEQLHIQAFHKFSLAPLIPTVIKGTNMEIIHDNMVKQGVQYGVFESGSKLGVLTKDGSPDKLYEDNNRTVTPWNGTEETKYTKNSIFLQYLKNQVDISAKWKNKTIFSTQLRKLIINDLFKQGVASAEIEGMVTEFEGLLDTLQSYRKQELLKEIGWIEDENGNPTGSPESFIKFVRKELSRQDLADHDIDFIDLNQAKTAIKYDLSYSLNAEKIEKLLNAIVVKRLVRQKMKGEQLVQLSGAGFETSNRTDFSKASEEDIKKYRGTNDLPTYRPGKGKNGATTAMKVKIAIKGDYYKLLELYHTDGKKIGTLERLNKMIKNDKWLDKDDNRKLITMVGVRIPVQGLNSMEFMEVYEFLPEEAGNILIPPAEIVAKSGADFDIDKLTIFQPSYSSKEKHAVYSRKDNAKGTENKIIESIRGILEHPINFDALIRPNDTDLVKGVADDLAKENIQGYNPLQKKDGTIGKTISPTRALEIRYNLYKHESNNVGKKTLGIGAVDNAYSSLFKRIGAYLNNKYDYRSWNKETNEFKSHEREIKIRMDHNSIEINGEKHISLSDIETVGKDKISDLISQLMNGWVDVERDAWIFNINGNNIAGPVMLFMLEAGVDFKTAAYFVCQPLVIDYIKERTQADSPFYQASGKGVNQGKGLNKYTIRLQMLGLPSGTSSKKMYAAIKSGIGNAQFTEKSLFKNIKQKDRTSPEAQQALMHFFELEDVMRDLTNIKLTMNVDTSPTKSFFASQAKLVDIEGLDQTNAMDYAIVNKLKTNSPIKSFFTQMFQLKLFKPLMAIRADNTVNEYLKGFIKNGGNQNLFKDPEKFVAAYKNDIPLFMLQNHLKKIDLNKITEYSSLKIGKGTPLEKAQIKIGAFVKDGVMYIDKKQLKEDFDNQAYTAKSEAGYKALGLHTMPLGTFKMSNNENTNFQEYVHYVLEREYLRSIVPVSKDQTRENYEKSLSEAALNRTFNFYTLLKGDNSIVTTFDRIKNAHPELVKDYMIFDQLVGSSLASDKGTKTLRLRSSKLDGEMANILHENLVRLADINTIKVENPSENATISKFFSRLIVGEYLRNGITKTSDSLAPILPTEMLSRLMEEPMKKLAASGITTNFLDIYTDMFESNWSSSKDGRNKFRNYLYEIKPPTLTEAEKTANKIKVQENEDGVKIYTNPYTKSEVAPLLTANPGIIFIAGVNQNNIFEVISDEFKKIGNFMGVPIKSKGGEIAWSDDNYDANIKAISDSLDAIQERIDDTAADVAFPADGLTTIKVGAVTKDVLMTKAPRTFEYLAKELYTRFKYAHPGAEKLLGFRDLYQGDKGISDKQVEDFMKQCFG